ncbi:MAG TPA: diguanylate cyclase [Pirellulaceae bacterium]|jgi:diguanylate cyclase|nr:diguanylate cyclase [Pirellulaceae bacterium]
MEYLYLVGAGLAGVAMGLLIAKLVRRRPEIPSHVQRETLARLQTVAKSLATDVGDHNERMQQIADVLMEKEFSESADVLLAVREILEASDMLKRRLGDAEKRLDEQAELLQEQSKAARTDVLTQVPNRRALDERLQQRLETLKQKNEPSSLMLLDVDHFKKFNDQHGHLVGDEALKNVAQALSAAAGDAFVARYGGEEFAVLFPGQTAEAARSAAELVRANVRQMPVRHGDTMLTVTASAGLAQLRPSESVAEWIRRADEALYESKKRGRDQGHWRSGDQFVAFVAERAESRSRHEKPRQESGEGRGADPITGLQNKDAFDSALGALVSSVASKGQSGAAMVIRLDGFSKLVESCGFRAAEVALKTTTQFLKATMRDTDRIGRYGQDTFALALQDSTLEDAERVAERLRVAIGGCSVILGKSSVSFTISCAITPILMNDQAGSPMERCREALESMGPRNDVSVVHDGRKIFDLATAAAVEETVGV